MPPARACSDAGRPWILVDRTSAERTPGFNDILRHLRAELALRKIAVCLEGHAAPIATVRLTARSKHAVEVVVDVRDAITQKSVSRVLDLSALPADARPLAIAVGTDELLRASWVEIAMNTQPRRAPPPPEVDDVVADDLRRDPRAELGSVLVYESYGGGQRFMGLDVRGGLRPVTMILVAVRIGMRQGLPVTAPNGTIRSTALLVGAEAKLAMTPQARPLGADVFLRSDVSRVAFVAEPNAGAQAHSRQGTALTVGAGVAGWLALNSALRLSAEASAGATLREVLATDTGSEVSAVAGLALAIGVGLAFVF